MKEANEEDQNGNEAFLLLRSEKYTNILENVKQEFQRRFFEFRSHKSEFLLFSDPFHCDPESAPTNKQLKLVELQESSDLKSFLRGLSSDKLYFSVSASTYSALRKHTFRITSLFGSI